MTYWQGAMVGATGVALGIILFAKAPKHSQWRLLAHLFLALGSAMIIGLKASGVEERELRMALLLLQDHRPPPRLRAMTGRYTPLELQ